ncbi:flap endonuclease-1 [Candidatus Woesearchaeota archaeon]|nr:flap endonuclease-1 [Candidatus Woesearchaeota archaeon]
MGTNLRDIIRAKEIPIGALAGKALIVDGYNQLYQFLTTIRQRDGTYLVDSEGAVTSHLAGLISRTTGLMSQGLRLGFVFDGKAPDLKRQERERRKGLKDEAARKYEEAKQEEDVDGMRKYAQRTARLTHEMVDEAKELIAALGLPVVQAPSEGEAQAARMVLDGSAYAAVSQDTDALLFGSPRVVRNLSIHGRKKRPGRLAFETVAPELLLLSENLRALGISQEQLIALAMLVGTDYDVGGIRGIGPKGALALVKEHGDDLGALFSSAGWDGQFRTPWQEVFKTIAEMPTRGDYTLAWRAPDPDKVIEVLCDRHAFSKDNILRSLSQIREIEGARAQKGLSEFF